MPLSAGGQVSCQWRLQNLLSGRIIVSRWRWSQWISEGGGTP